MSKSNDYYPCLGVGYTTKDKAERGMSFLNKKYFTVSKCNKCGYWHIRYKVKESE